MSLSKVMWRGKVRMRTLPHKRNGSATPPKGGGGGAKRAHPTPSARKFA